MALRGRFFDGETATEHLVEVTFTDDGVEIAGAIVRAFWRRQDVSVINRGGGWRLGVLSTPDARLTLDASPDVGAALRRLGIVDGRRAALRGWLLAGGLLSVSAVLAALVFVIIPLAAEPLAAMTPRPVEARLGENLSRQINVFMRPCAGQRAGDAGVAIAPLLAQLQTAAEPGFKVAVTFVRDPKPNAMAMPGGRVMVTSGLLDVLDDPEALAAVLSHEIGHVRARDGMVALYRNAGLGILLELITGGSGIAQQIVLIGGQLAELRYTRGQEERADNASYAIMRAAGHDPAALARAFEALKTHKGAAKRIEERFSTPKVQVPEWMSSHPDIERRIARAKAAAAPATVDTLTPEAWLTVRGACGVARSR